MPDNPKPASQTPAIHPVHIEQQDAHVWAYLDSFSRHGGRGGIASLDDAKRLWAMADELDEISALPPAETLQELDARKQRIDELKAHTHPKLATESAAPEPQAAPVVEAGATPWHLLATPAQLIDAFGKFTGMDKAWFNNAKDTPGLKAALHTAGKSGRGGREPLYYVMHVMQWLADPKRRKGRSMEQATGWRVLEHKFPKVHEEYLGQKPDME